MLKKSIPQTKDQTDNYYSQPLIQKKKKHEMEKIPIKNVY